MKAAILYEPNTPLVIEEIGTRKPKAREVLIRTAVSGLCHSDLHFIEGLYPHPLPMVLGHEASGVVEQVGAEVTISSRATMSSPVCRCFAGLARTATPAGR